MSALKRYIEGKNIWARVFGNPEISYPPVGADIDGLYESLDCDLSPENLTCDGEVSGRKLANKARHLKAALKELGKYGPSPLNW